MSEKIDIEHKCCVYNHARFEYIYAKIALVSSTKYQVISDHLKKINTIKMSAKEEE